MKILVTGGAGFIGSHIVDGYISQEHEVIVVGDLSSGFKEQVHHKAKFVNMSLSDPLLTDLVLKEKPDLINHQAAQVNVRASISDPMHDLKINLEDTVRLLDAAGQAGVKKFLFASSGGTVYGNVSSQDPIKESQCGMPISPYGINKLCSEQYLMFFASKFGFKWNILRYSNVYGPRQIPHGESGVIAIFVEKLLQGSFPVIYGNGEQIRDYVHVRDIVSANLLLSRLDETLPNDIFNVSTGIGTSLNQLCQMLTSFFPRFSPVYLDAINGDLLWNVVSNDKLRKLGWSPKISLQEGLHDLILCTSKRND